MLSQNNGTGLSAADIAAIMGNNRNGFGWGGEDGAWWLLVLLFALGGGGFGNFGWGGAGAAMGMGMMDQVMMWPYLMTQNLGNQMQNSFDTSGLTNQLSTLNQNVSNGFSNAEVAACNRTISQMQQNFNEQLNLQNRLSSMEMAQQKCCCDNQLQTESLRATVLQENCADRNQSLLNTRDIIDNQNANNQKVLDKLCQLELDGVKQNYQMQLQNQAMNYESQIRALANQNANLSLANQDARFDASQVRQTAEIESYVRPNANPAYIVPNPYAVNYGWNYGYGSGCGCNSAITGGFYG